ncbi:triphosphoribosyl-dephospho-CoA synthase CitG [Enterococcus faecalis]
MTNNHYKINPEQLSQLAIRSLLYEAALAPKPGLVDRQSNGAHWDMNFFTFIDSSVALSPYFAQYVVLGQQHQGGPQVLFSKVREVGVAAEKTMLASTGQINTHKGANFSFALFLSSLGVLLQEVPQPKFPLTSKQTQQLFAYIRQMTKGLVAGDFAKLQRETALSYGEQLYLQYGLAGIRQEAEEGYPLLEQLSLPYLRATQKEPIERRLLLLLLQLMQRTEDTNLINRGGLAAWQAVKKRAGCLYRQALSMTQLKDLKHLLQQFDAELTQQHLSPGGSVDLLALSIFLGQLEGVL